MRANSIVLASLIVLPGLFDCRSMGDISSGVCGNAVVDPGEDCDTFPIGDGTVCSRACRFDCSAQTAGRCPSGWGCGVDGVCRQPSGRFSVASAPVAADAWRVSIGDFDGDGRGDVLSRAAIDFGGSSKVRVHYFEPQANHTLSLAKALVIAPMLASPVIADFDADGRSDLAFVRNGLGVMLGRSDRTLSPVAYPAFTLSNASVRLALVRAYTSPPTEDFALFGKTDRGAVVDLIDNNYDSPIFQTKQGPDSLAGDLISAPFVDDPASRSCDGLVLAYAGATSVDVYAPCKLDAGNIVPNVGASPQRVGVRGAKTVDRGVRAADFDGDGHVDLLVGAAGITYVAFGDGRGHFHAGDGTADEAAPATVDLETGSSAFLSLPLDAADINGDGRIDFVTPYRVLVSDAPSRAYVETVRKDRGQWTDAKIADLNGDGLPDVVASSAGQLDADFFVGTGTLALNQFSIATRGAISHLAVGDYDGDRILDVVFSEVAADPSQPDELTIAFGRAFGPPDPPQGVGQFASVVQQVAFPHSDVTTVADIAVVSHPTGDPSTTLVAFLEGSGDRQPLALYQLTVPGTPLQATPLAIAPAAFLGSGKTDLISLGANADASFSFWLAPALGGARFGRPVPSPPLPKEFHPIFVNSQGEAHLAILLAAGDIDESPLPEVVAAAPFGAAEATSAIVVGKAAGGTPASVAVGPPITGAERVSPTGQLEFADIDGDGRLDAVLLTGGAGAHKLFVAWNEGGGKFDPKAAVLQVDDGGEPAQGFALVATNAGGLRRVAYVTRKAVVLAKIDGASRSVVARDTIGAVTSATGIAAGDVDGDGVQDLAVADDGNVIVLRGAPVLE